MKYSLKKAEYIDGGGKSLTCTPDKTDSWIMKQINEKCIIPTIKRETVNGVMKFSHVVSNKDLSSIVINVANYFLETEKTYSMLKNGNEFALKLQWKSCFSNNSEFISVLCLNNLCSKLMNEAMDDLFELNIFFPECFKTNLDLTNGCLTISIRLIFDNDFDEYVLNKIHALGFKNMEIAL